MILHILRDLKRGKFGDSLRINERVEMDTGYTQSEAYYLAQNQDIAIINRNQQVQ